MKSGLFAIVLMVYCILFDVHPNLISVSLALLWHAFIVETKYENYEN